MKILIGLILVLAISGCTFPGGDMGTQSKTWNNGKTDLVVDGNLSVSGELNKGRFAQIDAISSAVGQITTTGFLGDLHVRGTLYQQLGQQWVGPIVNPFGPASIYGVAFGNSTFVAVAAGGRIARSTDLGHTWGALVANNFAGAAQVNGIAFGGGAFVAVASDGTISRSTDSGATWSALIANSFAGASIQAVAFGNGVFVATSQAGGISYSTDLGATWSGLIANPFGGHSINAVAFGYGVFVAVSGSGEIARSVNLGVTWSSLIANSFGGFSIHGLAYGNGVFVATANSGKISTSNNGAVWSALITNPFGANNIYSVAYNFGVFQAGGANGTIARSYDNGQTWGSLIVGPFGTWITYSIASSTSNLVAVGQNGTIATAGWNAAYSLVNPNPGEPSSGTWHDIAAPQGGAMYTQNAPGAGTWYTVTFALGGVGNAPVGTNKVKVVARIIDSAVEEGAWFYRPYGSGAGQILARRIGTVVGGLVNLPASFQVEIPIDSAGRVEVSGLTGSAQIQISYPFAYSC